MTTEWQVLQTPPPLKFSLRLQDSTGQRWAAEDYVPLAGYAPTETWQPGQTVTDRHALCCRPICRRAATRWPWYCTIRSPASLWRRANSRPSLR